MKDTNQLKTGIILSYLNMAISMIIPLLYTPVMLRLMDQAEYGLYHLSNSVTGYLGLLSLGMGNAILRYLMKYHAVGNREMFCHTAGLFQVVYGIIAGVAIATGLVLTHFTGSMFGKGLTAPEIQKMNILLIIMATGAAISFLGSIYTGIIYAHEHHIFMKAVSIAGTVIAPLLNLLALFMGYASVGLALINVLVAGLTLLINVWYCCQKIQIMPRFDQIPWYMLKEILPFSLFMFISMVADMLFWAIDKVFIGAMIGTTAVAIYNIGVTFQGIMQSLTGAISSVFAPRVNALVFSGEPISKNSALLVRVGRIQYFLLSLILSGFIVFGRIFLVFWAGVGYEEAYAVALLTMIPMTIPLIQNVAFNTVLALNRHQFRSAIYFSLAVANAVSTYFLIPLMGIVGAALCTCVVFVLGHGVVMNWFYYKKIGLDIPAFWRNIGKMSIVPVGMLIMGIPLVKYVLPMTSLWWFLAWVVVYTAIFAVLSWMFSMNRYEKDLILSLVNKVLPRKEKE